MNRGAEIFSLLQLNGFSPALSSFATAQAAHETNNFTSALYRQNKNAYGMKYAGQALAKGEKNGFADYASIEDSAKDFVRWWTIKRTNIFSLPLYVGSVSSYVSFLKNNNYFEAPEKDYYKGVNYFYQMYFG